MEDLSQRHQQQSMFDDQQSLFVQENSNNSYARQPSAQCLSLSHKNHCFNQQQNMFDDQQSLFVQENSNNSYARQPSAQCLSLSHKNHCFNQQQNMFDDQQSLFVQENSNNSYARQPSAQCLSLSHKNHCFNQQQNMFDDQQSLFVQENSNNSYARQPSAQCLSLSHKNHCFNQQQNMFIDQQSLFVQENSNNSYARQPSAQCLSLSHKNHCFNKISNQFKLIGFNHDDNEVEQFQIHPVKKKKSGNPNFGYVSKINDLKKKIDHIKACHQRRIGYYKSINDSYEKEINFLKESNCHLKEKLSNFTEKISFNTHQNNEVKPIIEFSIDALSEMITNLKVSKCRRRYSQFFYDYSMLIFSQSPKCYRILRQVLPLPSIPCLQKKYSDTLNNIKKTLTDIDFAINQMQSLNFTGDCTLAIDAFSFRTFSGAIFSSQKQHSSDHEINKKEFNEEENEEEVEEENEEEVEEEEEDEWEDQEEYENEDRSQIEYKTEIIDEKEEAEDFSNGFIFQVIPLSSSVQSKIVHIAIAHDGSYNSIIDEKADFIKEKLREIGINPLFQATDGDRGSSHHHNTFFEKYFVERGKIRFKNFKSILTYIYTDVIQSNGTIPVSDP